MKIGFTGHQKRPGIDWSWVAGQIGQALSRVELPFEGWTSLAVGSDQLFANAVLDRGATLTAVLPLNNYLEFFETPEEKEAYKELLGKSKCVVQLEGSDPQQAFYDAGRRIADECSMMVAVWDGKPSQGFGGTADIVGYAQSIGRSSFIIDPIKQRVWRSGSP